jgi:hypothetical protein
MVLAREVEAKNFVLYIGHLGRRELVVQPPTPKKGRLRMRRILLVLSLTAVMVTGMAAPAMAAVPSGACPPSFPNVSVPRVDPSLPDAQFGLVSVESVLELLGLNLDSPGVASIDVNNDGLTCFKLNPSGHRVVFVDNHFPR